VSRAVEAPEMRTGFASAGQPAGLRGLLVLQHGGLAPSRTFGPPRSAQASSDRPPPIPLIDELAFVSAMTKFSITS